LTTISLKTLLAALLTFAFFIFSYFSGFFSLSLFSNLLLITAFAYAFASFLVFGDNLPAHLNGAGFFFNLN